MKVQIIVPMSGFGERFRSAGYKTPKPLIEVEGKPIIAHVIEMFPQETNFLFICNEDHLNNKKFNMRAIIKHFCPSGNIFAIKGHKLGPVNAIMNIREQVDHKLPTIINYCDFTCYWDWKKFKDFCKKSKCAGAIPAYKDFHPHSLGKTNYAYIKEKNNKVIDIQEKKPFTKNKLNEYASSGTYYFENASLMFSAFEYIIEKNYNVEGEYYVSMAYKYLISINKLTLTYSLEHFMQWGTPEDLFEYNYWSNCFREMIDSRNIIKGKMKRGSVLVPMAGMGKRFSEEGYDNPKPLIKISNRPMVINAINDLPKADYYSFLSRKSMSANSMLKENIKNNSKNLVISSIDKVTDGQATSAIICLTELKKRFKNKNIDPITIGVCDCGITYNHKKFEKVMNNDDIDLIVWSIRRYPNAIKYPKMYGWIKEKNNFISEVSVKKPFDNDSDDPIIIGIFTFKKSLDFENCYNSLRERKGRINNEYYIDSLIVDALKAGLKCYSFEVTSYLGWGTPNDLKTFQYWHECFAKWKGHPYSIKGSIKSY